jgi:beta-galactosidase/beta-glucuronidase
VPGDLITDLQVSGLIPEPYFENNFRNASLWNDNTWVYSTDFALTELELTSMRAGGLSKLLVFDGIKMGARVAVNGKVVGVANDEFLRYEWPLDAALHMLDANNKLEVTFDASIDCGGRWMACTYTGQHLRVFSRSLFPSLCLCVTYCLRLEQVLAGGIGLQ